MRIGLVREVKNHEYRVALRPADVKRFVQNGHSLAVTAGAGVYSGFSDVDYQKSGATILASNADVYAQSEMIIKVKEPIEEEYQYFRPNMIFYCYLHLAAERALTDQLLQHRVGAVAYETITDAQGTLPCLSPMSAIAGRLSVQCGSRELERTRGGSGVLLGGIPGTARGKVTIIGGGVVGSNACQIAVGMGARVSVLDLRASVLNYYDDIYQNRVDTLFSDEGTIEQCLPETDLLIGALLVPGGSAPRVIRKEHLKLMRAGSVIVDVSIDQGGCTETSRPTSHEKPTYVEDQIIHYCVTNIPGCVPRTSSIALANTTCNFGLMIANQGLEKAVKSTQALRSGLNTYDGKLCNRPVAESLGINYTASGI